MTINITHWGNDPMGAPTTHTGLVENCPAPECQDKAESNPWGVRCPHGMQIVEKDPEHTDPDGYPVGRFVDPWPCNVDGCTAEEYERQEAEAENEFWASMMQEARADW